MSDIDSTTLRRLDLTVLLVFLGLMRRRKAVEVAAELGLTQSAISHSIRRLRDVFGDPLFLRRQQGMEPTALAVALEPRIRSAVDALSDALRSEAAFDPKTAHRTLRIAAYDAEMTALVPRLLCQLDADAPGLRPVFRTLGRQAALHALDSGEVDLAIGYFWDLPPAYRADALHRQGYRVVARAGHPVLDGELTPERYAGFRHVVVSPAGDLRGIVDSVLDQLGLRREVVAAVPLFFPALAAVAGSDLIATLPARLVESHGARFGLESRMPPVPIREFEVSAVRHRRDEKNGMHDWLAGMLQGLAAAGES